MAKNSPNKRKSQSHEVQTPKKQKANEDNQKTPNKNKTPKGGRTPRSAKKNTQEEKLPKFSGTANLEEKEEDATSSGEESNYEVEQEVKPEKITKTMNEDNDDSENDDEDDDDDDAEDIDNAVNENSENGDKKQNNKNKNQPKVNTTKEINEFIEKESAKGNKSRYVLFIGNLPFVISIEEIKNHFKDGIQIRSVRLPQGKGADKKPRGFGYLEVANKESYLKAFSMHHTMLKGRRINVLYTAGGKKNSAKTKNLLKSKNFKLNAMRKEGKLDGCKKESQKRSTRRAKQRSFEKKTE